MLQEPIKIMEGNIFAYLLVSHEDFKIVDANSLARAYYRNTCNYPPLENIFAPPASEETLEITAKTLTEHGSAVMEKVFSTKVSEETFPCYLEICKVSENLLFFVIKEKSTGKDSQIEELVELTDNPIFVLEHNDKLSVCYGNERYHNRTRAHEEMQGGDEDSFLTLLPESNRQPFIDILNEELGRYGECNIDVEITFDGEYYQLFRFSAYKSLMDNRLYGVLISAKRQSELMKKIEYDQQYFDIMQKFSKDLLFRIDVRKSTLVHRGDISKLVGLQPEMNRFPDCIREINLIHPDDLEGYIAFVHRMMSGVEASYEPRFLFTNGNYETYRLQGSPLFDSDGNTVQVVGKCENIQRIVDIEAKANYDSLTTALNKQSFRELIEDMLARAVDRDRFAILFLDLDDFKSVNDTMGHVFGDFMLEATGKRILNCIRKQDRLGRVGGDEFVIFFQLAPSHESVLERAEAILHSLRREFNLEGQTCKTRASIGISFFPEHGDTYDLLYHRADKALYESKAKGKDVATIFFDELDL